MPQLFGTTAFSRAMNLGFGEFGAPRRSSRISGYNPSNLATDVAQSNLRARNYNVQLADLVNATNRAAQEAALSARLGPQGEATEQVLLENARRQAQGLLAPETEQMLQSGIAAGGFGRGQGVDSAALASAYRRALGQQISAEQAVGQQAYLGLLGAHPAAPIVGMESLLVSPATYGSLAASRYGSRGAAPRASGGISYPSGGYSPAVRTYSQSPMATSTGTADYSWTPQITIDPRTGFYSGLPPAYEAAGEEYGGDWAQNEIF